MTKSYVVRDMPPPGVRDELKMYPQFLQELLFSRGILNATNADAFLNPNYDLHVHDPFLLKDMEKAVDRILEAIEKKEKIIFYCDYDADGIPGGVVLHDFFKRIGYLNFENYFPHRYEEGYGLNVKAVDLFKEKGAKLIITIDCGISDVAPVVRANEHGIDVIITDHHLSQSDKVPPAYAIINPKQPDCGYPFNMLCGSGVVYKLVQGILKKNNFGLKEGVEKWFLDMVGLATMADMVPLHGENRVFAHYGLQVLRKSPRLGLMKLLRKAKVNQRLLTEDDIGFTIAPRINAASRMGIPSEAFDLLTASTDVAADELSTYIQKINDERKGLAAFLVKEVRKIVLKRSHEGELPKVIVVGNPDWKPALLGPVANNILDAFKVPVFLWGRVDGDVIKGSCRSDGAVSLLELMQKVPSGVFAAFGGHRCSGGFSIEGKDIHKLSEELEKAMTELSVGVPLVASVHVDKKIHIDDISWDFYRVLEKMAPFGEGNPKPLFLLENVSPEDVKHFGKEKNHMELIFKQKSGRNIPAIGFFMKAHELHKEPKVGERINLVATLEKSTFKYTPELRLRIVDIF